MRLGGTLRAAAEVLAQTEALNRPLAQVLKDWGVSHRFAGAKDRAFIGTLCYDVLRHRLSFQYSIGSDEAHALVYAAALACGETAESLAACLAGDKFAPPPLTAAQKRAWAEADISRAPLFVQADIPQWCAASFAKNFGETWVEEGIALAQRPPLDMRVNSLKADRQKLLAKLCYIDAGAFVLSPWAVRIAQTRASGRYPNVQAEAAFQKGWFEIQDCGSQIVALLCKAKPQEQVLDYCAGGGGKTLALSAAMDNRGQIHAYDIEKQRLAPIYERLRRAGSRNVQVHDRHHSLEPLVGRMDCVLLDAPCSGTGTWRRHPDTKWRLTAEKLQPRLIEQRSVLAAGKRYVKAGGRLVYVTCSLLYQENDAQICRFLAENDSFQLVDMQNAWAHILSANREEALTPQFTPFGLLLSPNRTKTDGFFVSILEKRG